MGMSECVGIQRKDLQGGVNQVPKEDVVKALSQTTAHPSSWGVGSV